LTLELCDKVTAVVDPLKNGNKAAGTTERGITRDNAPFSMPRSLMFAATARLPSKRLPGRSDRVSGSRTCAVAPDGVYEKARAQFSEQEIATLTLTVAMINAWNRLNVAFRTPAGGYKPGMFKNLAE
jgi:hypothetical protein